MPIDDEKPDLNVLQQRLSGLGVDADLPCIRGLLCNERTGFAKSILACLEQGGEETSPLALKARFLAAYLSESAGEALVLRLKTFPPILVEKLYSLISNPITTPGLMVDFLFRAYSAGDWSVTMTLLMADRVLGITTHNVRQFLKTVRALKALYVKDEEAFVQTVGALDKLRDGADLNYIERHARSFLSIHRLEKMVEVLNKRGTDGFNKILVASNLFKDDEPAFDLFLTILEGVEKHLFQKALQFMLNQKPFALSNPCVAAVQELSQAKKTKKLSVLIDGEILYAKDLKRFEAFYNLLKEKELDETRFTSDYVKSMYEILCVFTDDELFYLLLQLIREGRFYQFQPDDPTRGELRKDPFDLYKGRPAWFKWLVKVNLKHKNFHPRNWATVHELYADQPAKVKTLAELVAKYGGEALELFTSLDESLRGQDQASFDDMVSIIGRCAERGGAAALSCLKKVSEFVGTDRERLRFLADSAASPERSSLEALNDLVPKDLKQNVNIVHGLSYTSSADPRFLERDLLLHALELEKSEAGAGLSYVETLKDHWDEWKKELIGEVPATKHRDQPYYRALMIAVFGKESEYSDVDDAIDSPDVLEDVERFLFPGGKRTSEKSLPVQHGYRLVDGRSERLEALAAYKTRVHDSVRILAVLKEGDPLVEFRRLLEKSYSETELARFLPFVALSIEEMLIAILLNQNIKKDHFEQKIDLVLLYRFLHGDDWSEYAAESQGTVLKQPNEVSQHYQEWLELESLYGENMQHTFEHKLKGKVDWARMKVAYGNAVQVKVGKATLFKEKPRQKLKDLLSNEKIPADKKLAGVRSVLVQAYLGDQGLDRAELKNVESEVKRMVDVFFVEHTSLTDLSVLDPLIERLDRLFLDLKNNPLEVVRSFISKDLEKIQQSLNDYEENLVGSEEAGLSAVYTKTKESAAARMNAGLCVGADLTMYTERPNYLELILSDKASGECLGLTMHLRIEQADGKRYLWFGPNPSEDCLKKFGERETFNFLKRQVLDLAQANNCNGVVVPKGKLFGPCTNRGGKFLVMLERSRLKDAKGFKEVHFDQPVVLSKGEYTYEYADGILIWEDTDRQEAPPAAI